MAQDTKCSGTFGQLCVANAIQGMAALLRFSASVLICGVLMLVAKTGIAQALQPLAKPDISILTNGYVLTIASQADGSVLIGGAFTSVNGVARSNIAKLMPDGSVDIHWNPSASAPVSVIVVDPTGYVYVGGYFTKIGEQPTRYLVKLEGDSGNLVAGWNANVASVVRTVGMAPNGDIYIGGSFDHVAGQVRNHAARLGGSTGALDPGWNPNTDYDVSSIVVNPVDGSVYLGGSFTRVGTATRQSVARVAGDTGIVDTAWNPAPDGSVNALAIAADGASLYLGGSFSRVGGQARNRIAKISAGGTAAADPNWRTGANIDVLSLTLDSVDGSLYAGGIFTAIGGKQRGAIAKLDANGTGAVDPNWNPSANGNVVALEAVGGVVFAGGYFNHVAAQPRLGFTRIAPSGSVAAAADVETAGIVNQIARQPNGGFIVGGEFFKADQESRGNLLRLNADGTLDPAWAPQADDTVQSVAVDANGTVYVGGDFTHVDGLDRLHLAKIAGDGVGAVDAVWNPSPNQSVLALAATSDAVFAGGNFFTIGGLPRIFLAKLSANGVGEVDPNWIADATNTVLTLLMDESSDALYAGGSFGGIANLPRNHLAKLARSGTGAVDPNWNPSASGPVIALARSAAGDLYVGGIFGTVGGQPHRNIARVSATATGAVDSGWTPDTNDTVRAIVVDATGAVFIGGQFITVGGQPRRYLAKLSDTGTGIVDPDWIPSPDSSPINDVDAMSLDANGNVYAGGRFTQVGDSPRGSLVALPPSLWQATATSITGTEPAVTVVGQFYSVGFAVTSASNTPAGTVIVHDDLGTSCGPVTLDATGSGSCVLVSASQGLRSLTAEFTGEANFTDSKSAPSTHTVNRADTLLAIESHVPEPSTPAQPVTVAVSISVPNPGAGTPTGSIVVSDGVDGCSIPSGGTSCELILSTRGPRTLTASYAGDAEFNASSATAIHRVNRTPALVDDAFATDEDTPLTIDAGHGLLANDSDADGDPLTIANAGTFTAAGVGGSVVLAADGHFTYTPPANVNGSATFEYTVSDGLETSSATATIAVDPVNDPPSFSLGASPSHPPGTEGAQVVEGFASAISFGPPDESGQHVQAWVVRVIEDPAAICSNVAIAPDGTLSYTLRGNAGTAQFGVKLRDDGGVANGGDDTSPEQSFTISVAAGLDLSITIDDGRSFAQGGLPVVYTITVHNAGPNDAVGARVEDLLPFNLVDAHWACAASTGASCAATGEGSIDDTVNLPTGATLSYELSAKVLGDPETPIANQVSIEQPAGVPDMDMSNNSAVDTDDVGIFADGFD